MKYREAFLLISMLTIQTSTQTDDEVQLFLKIDSPMTPIKTVTTKDRMSE